MSIHLLLSVLDRNKDILTSRDKRSLYGPLHQAGLRLQVPPFRKHSLSQLHGHREPLDSFILVRFYFEFILLSLETSLPAQ